MEDLSNIWNTDDELNEEQLLNYVKGKLTQEEASEFERKMAKSSFLNDGVEGLKKFSSSQKINAYVQQVNTNLHQRLDDKKRKNERGFKGLSWEIIMVIAVILLCILGYVIVEMVRK